MTADNKPKGSTADELSARLQSEAAVIRETESTTIRFPELWQLHTDAEKERHTDKRWSPLGRWVIGTVTALAVTAGSLLGIGFFSPQVAEALRAIPFFEYLYAKGIDTGNLKPIEEHHLSSPGGAVSKDQGITFNMVDVYYDGIQLVLNYEVSYPPASAPLTDKDAKVFYDLNFEGHNPQRISTHDFTVTGEHTFVGTTRLSFGDKDLPDQLRMNMAIDCIGTTKGNWDLTIPLDKSKSRAMTTTVHPEGLDFTYNNSLYTVDQVTLGPLTSQVIVRSQNPNHWLGAVLEDDIGTLYLDKGGDGATSDYYYFNLSPLTKLNPRPAYVTLIITEPLENEEIKQGEDPKQANGTFPLVLQGNQGGTVTVTAIDYGEKQTVVYYEASQVMSQMTELIFREGQGDLIFPKGGPERISRDKLAFQLIFPPVQPSDNLEIIARYSSYSDDVQQFRLRIPLQWDQ